MIPRERVEAEAQERWPDEHLSPGIDSAEAAGRQYGFIAGRTVTADQVETAAKALAVAGGASPETVHNWIWAYRPATRAIFTAAGFIVEEET